MSGVENIAMQPLGSSAAEPADEHTDPVRLPEDLAAQPVARRSGGVLDTLSKLARPASTTLSLGLLGSKTLAPPTGPRAQVNVDKPRTPGTGAHSYGPLGVAQHALTRFTGISGNASDYNPFDEMQTRAGAQSIVAAAFGADMSTMAAHAPHRQMLDRLTDLHPGNFEHAALMGIALARVCNRHAARANRACQALQNPDAATPAARRDAFALQRALVNGGNGLDAVHTLRGLPQIENRTGHMVQCQALNTQMRCADRLLQQWPAQAGAAPETIETLTRLINTAMPAPLHRTDLPSDPIGHASLHALADSLEGRALIAAALVLQDPQAELHPDLGLAYFPARNNIYDQAQIKDFSAEMFGLMRYGLSAAAADSMLGMATIFNSTPLTSLKKGTGGQMMREPKADFLEFQAVAVHSITTLVGNFDPDAPAQSRPPATVLNMVRAYAVVNWCKQAGAKGWSDRHRFSNADLQEITRDAQKGLGIAEGPSPELDTLKAQVDTLKSVDIDTLRTWLYDAGADVSPGMKEGNELSALKRFELNGNTFAGGQLNPAELEAAVAAVAARLREAPVNSSLESELRAGALESWAALSAGTNPAGVPQGWTKGSPLPDSARDALAATVAGKLGRSVDDVKHSPEFAQIGPMGIDTLRAWARHAGIKDGPLHQQLTELTAHANADADDFVDSVRAAIAGARTTYPVIMQRTERLGFNMNVPLMIRDAVDNIRPALPKAVGDTAPLSLLMGPDVALAGTRVSTVVAGSTAISGALDVTRGYGVGGHAGWATVATANIGAPGVIKGQGVATGQLWLNGDTTVSKGWTLRSRMIPEDPEAWRRELLAGVDAMLGTRGNRPASPDELFRRLCEKHATNPDLSISPLEVTRYSGGPSFNLSVGVRGDINNWKPGLSVNVGAAASYTVTRRSDQNAGNIRTHISNNTFAGSTTFGASIGVGVPTVSVDRGPVATVAFPTIPVVGVSVVTVPVARGGTARISIHDGKIAPTTVWDDESARVEDFTARTEKPERRQSWIASLGGVEGGGEKRLNEFLNLCDPEGDKGHLLIADRQILTPDAVKRINTLLTLREIHLSGATVTPADKARYDACSQAISAILQNERSWKNRFLYLLENTVNRDVIGPDTMLTAQTINEVLTPHQLHALPASH